MAEDKNKLFIGRVRGGTQAWEILEWIGQLVEQSDVVDVNILGPKTAQTLGSAFVSFRIASVSYGVFISCL